MHYNRHRPTASIGDCLRDSAHVRVNQLPRDRLARPLVSSSKTKQCQFDQPKFNSVTSLRSSVLELRNIGLKTNLFSFWSSACLSWNLGDYSPLPQYPLGYKYAFLMRLYSSCQLVACQFYFHLWPSSTNALPFAVTEVCFDSERANAFTFHFYSVRLLLCKRRLLAKQRAIIFVYYIHIFVYSVMYGRFYLQRQACSVRSEVIACTLIEFVLKIKNIPTFLSSFYYCSIQPSF